MATLPNGKPIDMDMLEQAMDDSDLTNRYFLNIVTGEVVFFTEYGNSFEWSEDDDKDG